MDNYLGLFDGIEGAELADRMRLHAGRFGVEILSPQTVKSISAMGDYRLIATDRGDEHCAMAILLAV